MRKLIISILILSLMLTGCFASDPNSCTNSPSGPNQVTQIPTSSGQTEPDDSTDDTRPVGDLQNSDVKTTDPSDPAGTDPTENSAGGPTGPTVPEETGATRPSRPQSNEDPTDPTQQTEKPTDPTTPTEGTNPTTPPETNHTEPPATEPEETQPPATEPPINKDSYEFKRQVAQYAAQYINQYRAAAGVNTCTVLPGMTLVAEYRADQLTYNYSHDTADKREALAYYEYGRWVDATIVGLDPSESYYDADAAEAIYAGFDGNTAEEMGKYIADLCRNSSSHWSYLGSSKYSYIAVGVEYRAGSPYGWYGCIMVGKTNYG